MRANLEEVEGLGRKIRDVLEAGQTKEFAALMHERWLRKRERSSSMSNESINRWYDVGMENGALGGKLIGAGGGGFLLFYADEDQKALRDAMDAEGLAEVRFGFDFDGSTVIVRDWAAEGPVRRRGPTASRSHSFPSAGDVRRSSA
jgi:D-glycero-alpha-D-manno-heptose-7-phosphate kinase